jgi:hypothetical protein
MAGGLMQLVAYGAQDIYLTGNPQITFWKVVYRRHTNFAVESIEQIFSGEADFGKRVTCTISRNGDLINQVFLQLELPALHDGATVDNYLTDTNGTPVTALGLGYCESIGHAVIRNVQVDIGGQQIDKHYGVWLDIWNELTQTAEKESGFGEMIGDVASDKLVEHAGTARTYYIPLQFWFNRNPGLALPLIALQYHEVKLNIEFRSRNECLVAFSGNDRVTDVQASNLALTASGSASIKFTYCQLWVDYVYLDTEERRRFAQESHEYLIDQLQHTGVDSIQLKAGNPQYSYRMNFNHPTKELVWIIQRGDVAPTSGGSFSTNDWFNYSTAAAGRSESVYTGDLMYTGRQAANIQLNGHERFSMRPATYFRLVEPYKSHTRIPSKHIYLYAFGLRPEEHQPSGAVNMSRIDNAQLVYKLADNSTVSTVDSPAGNGGDPFGSDKNGSLMVFAVSYNVLRVMSGMGGLAYSN